MNSERDLLGPILGRLRCENELTLAELAERLGVSKPTVQSWENNKTSPRKERLRAIAEALSIAESELITPRHPADPLVMNAALADEIARSKARIALLAGTAVENVLILITYWLRSCSY
ncbi:helix-turn-helix domain-containing protein [Parafrankia sp. BMG5.11]|uniref:helix-turn-helix domain-containing protein n=1 Tax=Parafrankia sp. BMG5.11 TaxID=222540 RepID=UPI00103BC6BF|nr:XRE family transcriptional regulator [Parafrankia sp. BMG5.11]